MRSTQVKADDQDRLNNVAWRNNSEIIVLDPEFKAWIGHCTQAIIGYFCITAEQLQQWLEEYSRIRDSTVDELKNKCPKELFTHIRGERLRKRDSPGIL